MFGTVAASLFVQGLTIGPLLKRLGLLAEGPGRAPYERARGRALAARHALTHAETLEHEGCIDPDVQERLREWYKDRATRFDADARAVGGDDRVQDQLLEGLRQLADAERQSIREASHSGVLSPEVANELSTEVDRRIEALAEAAHEGDAALARALSAVLEK